MIRGIGRALSLLAHLLVHSRMLECGRVALASLIAASALQVAARSLADHVRLLRLAYLVTVTLRYLLAEVERVRLSMAGSLGATLLQRAARLRLIHVDCVFFARGRLDGGWRMHAPIRHLVLQLDLMIKLLVRGSATFARSVLTHVTADARIVFIRLFH